MKFRLSVFIILTVFIIRFNACSVVFAGENLTVLTSLPGEPAPGGMLDSYLKQQAYAAIERRKEAFEQLKSRAECREWQEQRRAFFLRQIGGLPERSPLNAEVVGTLQGEGYRVENILFESRPGFHVTANLYLPSTAAPWPGVIVPCGHSHDGKAAGGYQRICILLARHGMAAMCYDPVGQGERYQMLDLTRERTHFDNARHVPVPHPNVRCLCTEEHTTMGLSCALLGSNVAQYRIWDGMRAIDYLQSRRDIRPDKIGCTGNSGGGTLTAYLMALDDRIVAAAPVCYLTTFRRLIDTSGPQDAEQNIFGQLAFGMDEADYLIMRAPRPTLVCAGTRDATFDIDGTWDLFREAKRFYSRLGYAERVEMHEADAPHGFTIQLREGAVRWMKRWLLGQDEPLAEPELKVWSDAELQCTPQGQVMWLLGERCVFDLNRAVEADLEKKRQAEWQGQSEAQQRDVVRATAGIRTLSSLPPLDAMHGEVIKRTGYRIEKRLLQSEDRLPLPALAFLPEQRTGDVCLYVHGAGKAVDASVGGPIEKLVLAGHMVLAVDLSGTGETANVMTTGQRIHWSRPLFGPDGESFWLAYLIGKSLVGIRAEDILAASRYLAQNQAVKGEPTTIRLIAIGTAGPSALHALALEPQLYRALTLQSSLASWKDVVAAPLGNAHLTETVHGVLAHYDLPDLIRLSGGEKRVTMLNPIR